MKENWIKPGGEDAEVIHSVAREGLAETWGHVPEAGASRADLGEGYCRQCAWQEQRP